MPVVAVIGAQWGDEGKGKMVDLLAQKSRVVVRFSGGDNAGHTIVNPYGIFKLRLVPSGIFYPETTCIIGNGVVVSCQTVRGDIEIVVAFDGAGMKKFLLSLAQLEKVE